MYSATLHQPYETRCAGCHGMDGTADTKIGKKLEIASFLGSRWADAEPEAICEALRESPAHAPVLEETDAETLLVTCRKAKSLATAE